MATKAELAADLKQAREDLKRTLEKRDEERNQAEIALAEALAQRNAAIKALVQLEEELSQAHAAPPAPSTPESVGAVSVPSRLLVLVDAQTGEKGWVARTGGQSEFVVDFVGAKAVEYAKRTGFPWENILGGARIRAGNQHTASSVGENAQRWERHDGIPITVTVQSTESTCFRAQKATESPLGAGPLQVGQGQAFAVAVPASGVHMSADRGPDGTIKTLHLHLG